MSNEKVVMHGFDKLMSVWSTNVDIESARAALIWAECGERGWNPNVRNAGVHPVAAEMLLLTAN